MDNADESDWKRVNTSAMTVKLADFGCGRTLDGADSGNEALTIDGNLAYCAPEVLEGKLKNLDKMSYSRKSDIWSVAAVAYRCATGKLLRARLDCLTKPSDISHLIKFS